MAESKPEFEAIYDQLASLLIQFAGGQLQPRSEKSGLVELVGPPTERSLGREVWFGAVRIGKRYVSYHLMPVYAFPDLLNMISPELRKRMQGKSCFNFTHSDEKFFQELAHLTKSGYERFKREGLIGPT